MTKNLISGRQEIVNSTLYKLQMNKPKLEIGIQNVNGTFSRLHYNLQINPPLKGIVLVILDLNLQAESIHNEYNVPFEGESDVGS